MTEPLLRGISRGHLLALVVNCVVGAGVLGLPSRLYRELGVYSLAGWAGTALLVAAITLCFAEVGSRFPQTGGAYLYARATFGPGVGFLTAWLSMVTRVVAFASVCNLLITQLVPFLPGVDQGGLRALVVLAVVGGWSGVLALSVRHTAWVGSALTGIKVGLLLAVGLAGAVAAGVAPSLPAPGPVPALGAWTQAVLLMMFAFAGFEAAAVPGGEMKDPAKDLPVALLTGLGVITALYGLVQYAAIVSLPELASSERPVTDLAARVLGPGVGTLVALAALLMLSGTLLTQLLSTSRLLFALAEHGELPPALAQVHVVRRTPLLAIALTGLAAALATLGSTFVTAVTVTVTTRVITYFVVSAALVVLRRREDAPAAAFRVPLGDAVAGLSMVASLGLLGAVSWYELGVTIALVLMGWALYRGMMRR